MTEPTPLPVHLYDDGGDVLRVVEVNAQGETARQALGWMSALNNHIIDDARDDKGRVKADYVPLVVDGSPRLDDDGEPELVPDDAAIAANRRPMTSAEAEAYARRLLDEQSPAPAPAEAPKPIATF